jgi:hypothetical protein
MCCVVLCSAVLCVLANTAVLSVLYIHVCTRGGDVCTHNTITPIHHNTPQYTILYNIRYGYLRATYAPMTEGIERGEVSLVNLVC